MAPVDLTEKKGPKGFQLFSCCLPKSTPETEPEEEENQHDVPDMGSEQVASQSDEKKDSSIVRADAHENFMLVFWKMLLALMLFNFRDDKRQRAIKAHAEEDDDESAEPLAPPNMDLVTASSSAEPTAAH